MPRRQSLVALLLVAALVSVVAPVHAQDQDPVAPFIGRIVAAVRLEVEGRLEPSPALHSLIDVKVGEPFTREAYLNSSKRLQRLAPYASVSLQITDEAGGLRVVFNATPFHPVEAMQFIDDAHVNLEGRVKAKFGSVPLEIDPEVVRAAAIEILHGEGFMQATATVEPVVTHNPCRTTVLFHVTAGSLARIGKVQVDDRSNIPVGRLKAETGAVEGLAYRQRAIDDALQSVVNRLKKDGYYLASYSIAPTEAADHTFDLAIVFDPGPRVLLRWAKDSQPPSGDINTYVPIAQQNSIDKDLLDDSAGSIAQVLHNQGYLDAQVSHKSEISPVGEMLLTYEPVRGPRYRIERVEIPEGLAVGPALIAKLLGVTRGEVLDEARLSAGLQRIRAEYYSRGYYKVTATEEHPDAGTRQPGAREVRVVVRPKIVEGPKGVIAKVLFDPGTVAVKEADLRAVIHASRGDEGQPYQVRANEADRYALEGLYLNLGFRQAKVSITPTFSEDGRDVTRVVRINEGPLILIGDIRIVGYHHVSEKAIREELALGVGQPYGEGARLESRRKINSMGVFSRVTVQEDPLMPGETAAHLVIRVVEAPDTTIGFGGGGEAGNKARVTAAGTYVDRLEFAPRGFVELSRRNLGGRNRTIGLYTRISLRPKDSTNYLLDGKGYSFSEYKATLTYRERRAFGTDIDWVLSLNSEQSIRTSFNFVRNAANADFVRRLTARTTANLRYSLDFTRLYNVRFTAGEELDIDRVFNRVRLSMVSLAVVTDHRDDAISPTRGTFTSGQGDVALRGIGSQVGFVKLFVQTSSYHCVFACTPDRRTAGPGHSVVAARVEVGLARGFSRPIVNVDGTPGTVADLPASQRFFAGGSTSVRGFQLDRLGVPAVLTPEGLPLGGNGLLVLNAEIRTVVGKLFGRNFSAVQFADAGNVFANVGDIRLGDLRGSLGTGVRYDSPVGPIRLDFGFKLSRLVVGGVRERGWEFHLSFGEAF